MQAHAYLIRSKHITISQFALFLKDERQISTALDSIIQFSKVSGDTLNVNKCEIFALHNQPARLIENIQVKTAVKYLGITVTRHKEIREKYNFLRNID